MPGDRHRNSFRNVGANEVPNAGPSQIVKKPGRVVVLVGQTASLTGPPPFVSGQPPSVSSAQQLCAWRAAGRTMRLGAAGAETGADGDPPAQRRRPGARRRPTMRGPGMPGPLYAPSSRVVTTAAMRAAGVRDKSPIRGQCTASHFTTAWTTSGWPTIQSGGGGRLHRPLLDDSRLA